MSFLRRIFGPNREEVWSKLCREIGADFVKGGFWRGDKVLALFSNPRIRWLIQSQPSIHLQVKDDEGWFGKSFPEGVDELYFEVVGIIKEVERLRFLYEPFAETLNHLCHIGSAYEDDPNLVL